MVFGPKYNPISFNEFATYNLREKTETDMLICFCEDFENEKESSIT